MQRQEDNPKSCLMHSRLFLQVVSQVFWLAGPADVDVGDSGQRGHEGEESTVMLAT